MTKKTLQAAINAMLDGKDVGNYHDELTMLFTLVCNATDESIAAAWSEVHIDEDTEGGTPNEEEQNRYE